MGKFKDKLKQFSQGKVFKALVGALPFGVGDIASAIVTDTKGEDGSGSAPGTISAQELGPRGAKVIFYAGLVYSTLHCILQVFE